MAFGDASLRPPLSVIIKAHPALDASRAVLPKGSLFLGQTTEISDLINHFVTILFFWYPKIFKFLCLKTCFSLGSSPITIAFHSG